MVALNSLLLPDRSAAELNALAVLAGQGASFREIAGVHRIALGKPGVAL